MEIRIDGKKAGIILESETTLGEVLTGIYTWLGDSGFFISGLEVDGTVYNSRSMEGAFDLPLAGINTIDITTSLWTELMMEALGGLRQDIESHMAGEKKQPEEWGSSPVALFLEKNSPELYDLAVKTLQGDVPPENTLTLVLERIREAENPEQEIAKTAVLAKEIAQRLEDLPLDMQTGKDSRAAETITLFSPLVEKIYRLLFLFRQLGADIKTITVEPESSDPVTLKDYMDEFGAVLGEFSAAYENKDTVLVGDLAEYELAPRLVRICGALCGIKAGKEAGEKKQG
ncbi:MAG: hypothetical protein LBO65_06550 [Spirochaetaceae bacterium]|jgi:hypothetical protein|nr:hypothetical protein [Spirochaetaceae bacterium]